MATTLKQFWSDEVARISARLASLDTELTTLRGSPVTTGTLTLAQDALAAASSAVATQTKAADDARKALAGIPMPGDADPLLVAMAQALMDLADARANLAGNDQAVQAKSAELNRLQGQQAALQAALSDANKALSRADKDAATRQTWVDALTSGDLMNLATDAAAALAASEATARARVEGEFPSNATPAKDFLSRARARRGLAQGSLTQASTVASAAVSAASSALARAQRSFDAAALAVRQAFDAAPRLATDSAELQRLAALPAAHPAPPTRYPIVSVWQHQRLHDASQKTNRENALAKLSDVDQAAADLRTAQAAYDSALHTAMAANPDQTQAELDAGVVKPKKDDLSAQQATLSAKRGAISGAEISLVKAWFAAVPNPLWDALDQLDSAVSRLMALVGPPAPAALIAALTAAEAALVTALDADRVAQRQLDSTALAAQRASDLLASERATAAARASAFEHGATLF